MGGRQVSGSEPEVPIPGSPGGGSGVLCGPGNPVLQQNYPSAQNISFVSITVSRLQILF